MTSIVTFRRRALTPNQPPFLLARSIEDGPGKLHLLIWHTNGVYSVVSLDEAARLRAEDGESS
jgi:hypothetical protein